MKTSFYHPLFLTFLISASINAMDSCKSLREQACKAFAKAFIDASPDQSLSLIEKFQSMHDQPMQEKAKNSLIKKAQYQFPELVHVEREFSYDPVIRTIQWDEQSNRVLASSYKSTQILDVSTGNVISIPHASDTDFYRARWLNESMLFIQEGSELKIWDIPSAQYIFVLYLVGPYLFDIKSIATHAETSTIFFAYNNYVHMFVADSTYETSYLFVHSKRGSSNVKSIEVNQQGTKIVTACTDKKVRVWDIALVSCIQKMHHRHKVNNATWNKTETLILSCDEGKAALIWDEQTGECIASFIHKAPWVRRAIWSNDETKIITGSTGPAGSISSYTVIWDIQTRTPSHTFEHPGIINSISLNADDSHLLTGCWGSDPIIWDIKTSKPFCKLRNKKPGATMAHWDKNEQRVITNGSIPAVWKLPAATLQQMSPVAVALLLKMKQHGRDILEMDAYKRLYQQHVLSEPEDSITRKAFWRSV